MTFGASPSRNTAALDDAMTEAILSRIDSEFEVALKQRPPEALYRGTGHHNVSRFISDADTVPPDTCGPPSTVVDA